MRLRSDTLYGLPCLALSHPSILDSLLDCYEALRLNFFFGVVLQVFPKLACTSTVLRHESGTAEPIGSRQQRRRRRHM